MAGEKRSRKRTRIHEPLTKFGQSSSEDHLTLLSFGVRQPVAANLLMMAIIIAGIMFGLSMRREMFPKIKQTELLSPSSIPVQAPMRSRKG